MSFSRYENYKDSGISWLGEIPTHWQTRRAKFLFDRKQRPISDEDDIVTAFRDGQVTMRKNRREDGFTVALKEIGYQGVRQGDLVIHAMDAFAGAVGVSDSDGKCSPVYSCCEPKENVLASFYGNLVRTMALAGFIESLAKGIRERSTDFRWGDFSSLELPLPPIREQEQAVSFIIRETGKIDDLVAEQKKLIELLKEKRQAVISHAVTKGLDPNARMKDSGIEWLGEVPESWKICSFTRIIDKIEQGWSPNASSDPCGVQEWGVIKLSSIKKGNFFPSENKALFEDTPPDLAYEIHPGDLLITRANTPEFVGDSCIAQDLDDHKLMLSDLVYRVHIHAGHEKEFICNLLISKYGRSQIEPDARGSSMSMAKISQRHIKSWKIALPPSSEQKSICAFIRMETAKIDALIEEAQKTIELMKERRTALIAAAVTGKIDVRGYEAARAEAQEAV